MFSVLDWLIPNGNENLNGMEIENFTILFEIMNPDTKIDEQSKSNVENLVM